MWIFICHYLYILILYYYCTDHIVALPLLILECRIYCFFIFYLHSGSMDSLVTLNMEFRLFFFVTFWIIIIGRKALGIVRGAPLGTPDASGGSAGDS